MESKAERKAAIEKFKERKQERGAYAIRCSAAGKVWVGSSMNLRATKNGTWFMLRAGNHRTPELQRAWNERGESAFAYEVLEQLKDDVEPIAIRDLLKQMETQWRERLGALRTV